MSSIQPRSLSDQELLRYAYTMGHDKLPVEWVTEIIVRFEALLDTTETQ